MVLAGPPCPPEGARPRTVPQQGSLPAPFFRGSAAWRNRRGRSPRYSSPSLASRRNRLSHPAAPFGARPSPKGRGMTTLVFIFALSCVTCLVLTPLARAGAACCGLVDRPDGRRKIHARATPVAGGLAILASGTLALGVALLASGPVSDRLREQGAGLLGMFAAALVIAAVGVTDDCLRRSEAHTSELQSLTH